MKYFILVACLAFGNRLAEAQTCIAFPEILEDSEEFDTEYASINEDGKRPLGFLKDTAYYDSDPNDPLRTDPCYTMSGLGDRYVEILFETIPPSVLCFDDQEGNSRCSDTRHQECKPANADTMTFNFYNDVGAGSSEADITFWLRIYKGPPREEDSENMWCQWRDNEYPESLQQLPVYVMPVSTEPPAGGATSITSALLLLVCSLTAALATLL